MTEKEKKCVKEDRVNRQMTKWWNDLTDRLLEQEEIEDYYYECRVEPDTEEDMRYISHMYPVWWAGNCDRWDAVRRLCEKGYSFSYRKEQEPVVEEKCLSNKSGIIYFAPRSISADDFWERVFLKNMFFYAMRAPKEEAEWFVRQLEACHKQLEAENPKRLERLLHYIRTDICRMRNKRAFSKEQEMLLDTLSDRLPQFYHAILCDGALWFDISLSSSTKWTMGLPDFSLLTRYWEHCEGLETCGDGVKNPELWRMAEGKTVEDARLDRWSLILENSMEKWLVFGKNGVAGEQESAENTDLNREYEALFERMSCFFRDHCKEKALRERYRDSIREQLSQCKEMRETAPKQQGGFWRANYILWVKKWEKRLQKELEDLEVAV